MFDLLQIVVLLVVAYVWGRRVEKRHYKVLLDREAAAPAIPVIEGDRHQPIQGVERVAMVNGSVVLSADYFKYMLSSLVGFFGGNLASIESVLERGRREAVMRLKEQAADADFIANLRYETTSIASGPKSMPQIEMHAYATAVYLKKDAV